MSSPPAFSFSLVFGLASTARRPLVLEHLGMAPIVVRWRLTNAHIRSIDAVACIHFYSGAAS